MKKRLNLVVSLDEYKKLQDDLLKFSIYTNKKITFSKIVRQLLLNLNIELLYNIGVITDLEYYSLSNLSLHQEKNKQYKRLKNLNVISFKHTRFKPQFLQPKKTDKLFSDRLKKYILDDEKKKYDDYLEYRKTFNKSLENA